MSKGKNTLANELAELSTEASNSSEKEPVTVVEPETTAAELQVLQENIEAAESAPQEASAAFADLQDEVIALRAQLADLTSPEAETEVPELPEGDTPDLYYEGIIHPDYRLKSVYVPFNAQGVSKANGYDAETGESYVYTTVKLAHLPPGGENHRMETYNIRLDHRVVVPAFVAEALGNRADTQDFYS